MKFAAFIHQQLLDKSQISINHNLNEIFTAISIILVKYFNISHTHHMVDTFPSQTMSSSKHVTVNQFYLAAIKVSVFEVCEY